MKVVLACDLGGTSFRAALMDIHGRVQAEEVISNDVPVGLDGCSECDPEIWWQQFSLATERLAQAEPSLFKQIEGIAICGFTRTQVLLNSEDRSIRPAITWKDTRSSAIAAKLRMQLGPHPEAEHINAFHPLSRLAWLAAEEPAHFEALDCILEPKDWLNLRLTGRRASDLVSMARLATLAEDANHPLPPTVFGYQPQILPDVVEPWGLVGPVQPNLPGALGRLRGVPVFCSSNDTWAAVTGLGAMRAGFAYNISGTTEVLGMVSKDAAFAEGLLTVDWCGLWQLGGPSQNGADTAAWLMSLLGDKERSTSVAKRIDQLLQGARHAQPLLFLPYLQGERTPYWNPALRGAFLGLERQHGATDLAYAVLEGVAYLNRIVLERAEASFGGHVSEIRFGGGASNNPIWAQIKADVCNRPLVVGQAKESGLLGAAIVAWTGSGHFDSLSQAQLRLATVAACYEPNAQRHDRYESLFHLFRRSEAALAPISAELVEISRKAE